MGGAPRARAPAPRGDPGRPPESKPPLGPSAAGARDPGGTRDGRGGVYPGVFEGAPVFIRARGRQLIRPRDGMMGARRVPIPWSP